MGLSASRLQKRLFHTFTGNALALAMLSPGAAFAQTAAPAGAAPTREEVEQKAPATQAPPANRLTVEGGVEHAPCALDRPEYAAVRFTPTEVAFDDLKGLPAEALRPAYQSYLGSPQPVSVVCEIRDRAATILRDAGYIASVEVPEQRIADGKLRFQVLMARIVRVTVRGDAGRAERKIASYLERLTQDEVFNKYRAERALLLAGELPGYSVRLALRSAGGARGEVIGEVTVQRTPFMVDANIQNYGSHELGRWGGMVRAQLFGLTGLGDRTTFSMFSTFDTDEQQTLQIGHDFKPGNSGLTISGQFTYSWTHPDLGDPSLDIKARTMFATLEASYPFLRSQEANVRGGAGIDIVNQDVEFNKLDLSRDRLRVAFVRLTADAMDNDFSNRGYNYAEPRWRAGWELEARHGLDILDANEDCRDQITACTTGDAVSPSRLEGNPTATVLRVSAQGEFRPIPHLTFALGARGQYSSSPLLSFEEFSGGNYTVGRGYDAGTITGDRGLGFQAEVRFGSTVPRTRRSVGIEPYLFVDQALVWNEDSIGGPYPRQELTSAGGGVRASIGDQFRVDLTVAAPLDRVNGDKPDPRVLFSLSSRLWPWSFR